MVFKASVLAVSVCIIGLMISNVCFADGLTITSDMQYEYALECHRNGSHETAMVEWKRFLHFFPSDPRIPDAQFYLGMSLFHLEKWDEARAIFQSRRFLGSARNIDSFFMLSRTLLAQGRPGGAERVLRDLIEASDVPRVKDRALSDLAWIYLGRAADMEPGALERAEAFLSGMSMAGERIFHATEIKQTIVTILNNEAKSPWLAGTAALVPGAGFAYCERYRDALAALVINTGLILAAHESFDHGNNILGGIISVVASGFYGGSIYGSISSAHKYNRSQIRKGLNAIEHFNLPYIPEVSLESSPASPSTSVMIFSMKIPF